MIGIDIILTGIFNVNSGERVSLVSVLSLANCTAKNREVILLVYVDPFEKLCAKYEIGGRKKSLEKFSLQSVLFSGKNPKLNISTRHSGVLFCFYLRTVKIADTNVWCKIIIYVKNTEMCICSKYFILLCVV